MHITEGIITGLPSVIYTAAGACLMAGGARSMRRFAEVHPEKKPLLGMAGAFIFFVSLIPLPSFAGTCSHPCGSPLAGILLGPWIGIALTGLSLFLQAAFFAHGGFSTWGANLVTLGIGGAFTGWLAFRLARRAGCPLWLAGGLGGLIGDVGTYLVAGLSLSAALANAPTPQFTFAGYLAAVYGAYFPIQGPIAIGEMVVTGLALHYIYQQRPGILSSLNVIPGKKAALSVALAAAIFSGLVLPAAAHDSVPDQAVVSSGSATGPALAATHAAPSSGMAGMDEAVNERMAEDAGRPPLEPYINTEAMGDVWNTLMLGAGGICGFVLGRWWHMLFGRGQDADRAAGRPSDKESS